ncbi:MAG: hypothetical protein SFT68_00825 [Rickettsiaceae bacterium]|nr:hypothetical protein [Rickettsiaceae bacterium]
MYLKTTKGRTNSYVSIVKSYRDTLTKKPRQQVVKNLGSFDTEEEKLALYTLGANLIKSMSGEVLFSSSSMKEIRRENYGASLIMDRMFEIYKLDKAIEDLTSGRKIEYDLISSLKFMISSRFLTPLSKLASFNQKHKFAGFGDIKLESLYKSLDEIARYEDDLKSHLWNMQNKINKNEYQ